MIAALAALPIVAVLAGMAGLGWSAARAGAAGLALAALLAIGVFGFGARAAPGVLAEAAHTTAVILWIVLPALMLHAYGQATGGVERLRDALARLAQDPRDRIVLIAWFFGLFMEGAAGFGAPVALAAPLLVGLGLPAVRAVAAALLGHASGVSFGAIGTPALALAEVTGTEATAFAWTTAALHAALGWGLLVATVQVAAPGPFAAAVGRSVPAAAAFLVPYVALAAVAGPELPTLGAALLGGTAFAAWRMRGARAGGAEKDSPPVLADLAPYLAVVLLVLLSRLVPPLREVLSAPTLAWRLPGGFEGSFAPLYHPGSYLLLGLVLAALATGRGGRLLPASGVALRRLAPVALALGIMILLARLMVHAGMIETLARAAAGLGPGWPVLAPSVGALGTFVTGSATASNVLFGPLQADVAAAAELPAALMLAAQGYGAALGNVVAPHNVVAGAAAVGLAAQEGAILRRTALPAAASLAAAGALVLVAARLV
ncbi:L-lactate permease [Jannaschia formosa]|uniref:L-lactate permease n=1 Tax=Jannaschia formosa TaxID=2259592 RepID=UPI000E1B719C|nr:L-lactate permease [Jannaschia formosa]TFL16115.1 L-lactate permease [Jannaschia formosa]